VASTTNVGVVLHEHTTYSLKTFVYYIVQLALLKYVAT